MGTENNNVLVINAGSSSIKLHLFSANPAGSTAVRLLDIAITGIGQPSSTFTIRQQHKEDQTQKTVLSNHGAAVDLLVDWLTQAGLLGGITAVGHRIVHGGSRYSQPKLVTDELIDYLETILTFDPEHIPASLQFIKTLQQSLPNVPQVACFDTAFFKDLPRMAQLLTLPNAYQAEGLRRYGFHGLSYTSLDSEFRDMAGNDAANGRVIYAHLGSGASLAAVHGGKPIDTTMGFTPASGIVMSTRTGDIDPGISWFLQQQHGVSPEQFQHMVNFESGLLGISGLSGDMYTLLQNETTNEKAADAVNLFVYQVKKAIGSLTTTLGGLDSLVFSGGIGEQAAGLRARICEGLEFLGIELDSTNNGWHAPLISTPSSRVGVHVLPTNEANVIYDQVITTLSEAD